MSQFEMECPEDIEGQSSFLKEPGTYHCVVIAVDEAPTSKAGVLLEGFRVDFAVLDGTVANQKDKQFDVMFFKPKLTDKNGGELTKRKQARFCLATGILQKASPGQRVIVDLQQAAGRQLVLELEHQKDQQTGQPTKFLQLAWANIYHVDDPAVAKVPKDATALALLPVGLRKTAADFAKKPGGQAGEAGGTANGGGAAKPSPSPATPPATPAAGAVNLDDL